MGVMNLCERSKMRQLFKLAGLVILLTLAGCKWDTQPPEFKADFDLTHLQLKVMLFENSHGRYPTSEEGLDCLIKKPRDWASEREWEKMLDRPESLTDPWGRKYKYLLHPELKYHFVIYTISAKGLLHSLESEDYPTSSLVKLLPDSDQTLIRQYKRSPAENRELVQRAGSIVGVVAVFGVLFSLGSKGIWRKRGIHLKRSDWQIVYMFTIAFGNHCSSYWCYYLFDQPDFWVRDPGEFRFLLVVDIVWGVIVGLLLYPLVAACGGERVRNPDKHAYFSCVVVAFAICAVRIVEFAVRIPFHGVPTLVALAVPLLLLPLFRSRKSSPEQCIPVGPAVKLPPPLASQQPRRP